MWDTVPMDERKNDYLMKFHKTVVLICTDNQSPWSLGCYGNKEILTPNIDRLAKEGMLFEHSYSSNPVCSPARATLLTAFRTDRGMRFMEENKEQPFFLLLTYNGPYGLLSIVAGRRNKMGQHCLLRN